jgi:hypothetical protein
LKYAFSSAVYFLRLSVQQKTIKCLQAMYRRPKPQTLIQNIFNNSSAKQKTKTNNENEKRLQKQNQNQKKSHKTTHDRQVILSQYCCGIPLPFIAPTTGTPLPAT